MENIELKIERTRKLLDLISDNIDRLSFETFDSTFPIIVKSMQDLHKVKNEIVDEFGLEAFLRYETDLLKRAKQIERKFDTIVGIFSSEEKKLEKELFGLTRKKKIANYLRY
jgi:hypothetical protein